jgi:hypothetical protein
MCSKQTPKNKLHINRPGSGTWLASREMTQAHNLTAIRNKCRKAVELLRGGIDLMTKLFPNLGPARGEWVAEKTTAAARKFLCPSTAFTLFLALLTVGTALGAGPSGQITANPQVVIVPAGASSGSTSISWSTRNCAAAQVTVTAAGGTEQLFGDATSFQNSVAPWIGLTSFTFRLYGDRTRTLLLDSVVVTGVRSPSGSITAVPVTFNLPTTDATFSTTLTWATSEEVAGWVTRSVTGGGEQLIAQGGSNAGFEVSGLGAGETTFRLYGDEARTLLLGSMVVTGVLPLPGTITASLSTFTLGTNATLSTALSWTMSQGSVGWVTQSTAGSTEQLVAQGGTTLSFEVSGLEAGRTLFRLYGDEARTQLLDSVEVIGTTSPLTVQPDGTLRLDNRPFTGIGVNYYGAFYRVLENANDTSYDAGFAALGRWGVPFARLDFSAYWPVNANFFFTNRTEYFRRLDGVVASAEPHGVGLIPTLFWTTFTFSDLAGERLDQLVASNSVTRQKMREFATEIVNRYKDSRAIWAWEFGNEWNLAVDLPNGAEPGLLPPTWTSLGNPATRDPVRDVLATDTILPAMREFAELARELDPGRPISTGHAMSRPSQWHQDQWKRGLLPINSAWTTDSVEQAEEIALRQCPDPYDLLSVHVYESDPQRLPHFATFAAKSGKALFAGEFGTAPAPSEQANYAAMLLAVRAHSPLAAVWVFDRSVDDFNITTTNARSWMLRDLLPATFANWSRGCGPDEVAGPSGMSVAAQYVLGAPRPGIAPASQTGWWSTNTFSLEAVVRTNDPSWRIFGESSATLSVGSWSTNEIFWHPSANQSDLLPGSERRVFRVPTGTNTKKFLRINAQNP